MVHRSRIKDARRRKPDSLSTRRREFFNSIEGFRNVFAAYEKSGEGAVVMTSGDNGAQLADEVMHSVATEYGWPDWKPTVRTAIKVDEKILEQYVGIYQLAPKIDLVATVENGQLNLRANDQPKFPVYAETETKFFLVAFSAEIEFTRDAGGKVVALTLHRAATTRELHANSFSITLD